MPQVSKQQPVTKKPATDNIISRIVPISKPTGGMRVCIYGHSGKGKTTLACSFPKPLLLIRAEDGRRSVYNVAGVDDVAVVSTQELRHLIQYQKDNNKYKTLVLDSVTAYSDIVLKEVLQVSVLPAQLAWGTATQSQWGDVALGVKDSLAPYPGNGMFSLDCNVVITGLEREFNNEGTSTVLQPYVGIGLTPSAAGWVHKEAHYLVRCFTREKMKSIETKVANQTVVTEQATGIMEYCLQIGTHPTYLTKYQVPRGTQLPAVMVDPTYEKMAALIK